MVPFTVADLGHAAIRTPEEKLCTAAEAYAGSSTLSPGEVFVLAIPVAEPKLDVMLPVVNENVVFDVDCRSPPDTNAVSTVAIPVTDQILVVAITIAEANSHNRPIAPAEVELVPPPNPDARISTIPPDEVLVLGVAVTEPKLDIMPPAVVKNVVLQEQSVPTSNSDAVSPITVPIADEVLIVDH
jgi:hypothetical protein